MLKEKDLCLVCFSLPLSLSTVSSPTSMSWCVSLWSCNTAVMSGMWASSGDSLWRWGCPQSHHKYFVSGSPLTFTVPASGQRCSWHQEMCCFNKSAPEVVILSQKKQYYVILLSCLVRAQDDSDTALRIVWFILCFLLLLLFFVVSFHFFHLCEKRAGPPRETSVRFGPI